METTVQTLLRTSTSPAHSALGPLRVLTCVHAVCRERAPIAALTHVLATIDAFVCPRLLECKSLADAAAADNVHLLRRLLAEELAGIERLPHHHDQRQRLFVVGLHIASAAQSAAEKRLPNFRRVLECLSSVNPHAVGTNSVVAEAAAARDLELLEWLHDACPSLTPDLVDSSAAADRAAGNGDTQTLEWLLANRWSDSSTVPVDEAVANSQLPVLRWLEDRQVSISIDSDAIYTAAKLGDIEMLAWLFAHPRDETATHAGDGAASSGHLHVLEWLFAHYPSEAQCGEFGYARAARNGHLEVLQWLYAHYPKRFWTKSMEGAAQAGHLSIVQFLLTQRDDDSTSHVDGENDEDGENGMGWSGYVAAMNGHLDVVKCIYQFCEGFSVIQGAAVSGNLDMIKWLHEEHDAMITAANVIHLAITYGHLHVLEYIVPHRGDDGIAWAIESAASCNRMDIVQWFHAMLLDPNSPVQDHSQGLDRWMVSGEGEYSLPIDGAASHGNIEMIEWLAANGYSEASPRAMDRAAEEGHLETVKWLHANRTEGCTTAAMDRAAGNGHLAVVQWLHANRTEGCTTDAVDLAVRNGHARVAAFLLEHRTEGCTTDAVRDAIETHHDAELVHLLFTHRRELIDLELVRAHAVEYDVLRVWLQLVAECA